MDAADIIFQALKDDFGFDGATGSVRFNLKDFAITVEQNNIVGNILEEWLAKWMNSKGFPNIHNARQESPDFWLNPDNLNSNWLEVKAFTGSPNFDIANFRSFIQLIIDKPYKLQSKYLLIRYTMEDGVVKIEDCWLKKVWEISSPSGNRPVKVQEKRRVIYNLRPCVWYSNKVDYPSFDCLEDFLAALEETIYNYPDTRNTIAETWKDRVIRSYEDFYGERLNIPRWYDIKSKYNKQYLSKILCKWKLQCKKPAYN